MMKQPPHLWIVKEDLQASADCSLVEESTVCLCLYMFDRWTSASDHTLYIQAVNVLKHT